MRGLEAFFSGLATGYTAYNEAQRRRAIQQQNKRNAELKQKTLSLQSRQLDMQVRAQAVQLEQVQRQNTIKDIDGVWRRFITDNSFEALNEALNHKPNTREYFGNATRFDKLDDTDYEKLKQQGKNVEYMKRQDPNRYARKYYIDPKTGGEAYKVVDLHAIRKGVGFYQRDAMMASKSVRNNKRNEMEIFKMYENQVAKTGSTDSFDAGQVMEYRYLKDKFTPKEGMSKASELDLWKALSNTPINQLDEGNKKILSYLDQKYGKVGEKTKDPNYFVKLKYQHDMGKYTGMDKEVGDRLYWAEVNKMPTAAAKRHYEEEYIKQTPKFVKYIKADKRIDEKYLPQLRSLEMMAGVKTPETVKKEVTDNTLFVKKIKNAQEKLLALRPQLKDSRNVFGEVQTWWDKHISDTEWSKKTKREKIRALASIKANTEIGMILSEYLKMVSGTAVPDSEYDRIFGLLQAGKNANFDMVYTAMNAFGNVMKNTARQKILSYANDYTYSMAILNNDLLSIEPFKPLEVAKSTGDAPSTATKGFNVVMNTAKAVNKGELPKLENLNRQATPDEVKEEPVVSKEPVKPVVSKEPVKPVVSKEIADKAQKLYDEAVSYIDENKENVITDIAEYIKSELYLRVGRLPEGEARENALFEADAIYDAVKQIEDNAGVANMHKKVIKLSPEVSAGLMKIAKGTSK